MGKLPAQTAPPANPPQWPKIFRSIAAIVTGYVTITVLVTLTWVVLAQLSPSQFGSAHAQPGFLTFLIDSLIAVGAGLAAGFLTALIAGRAEITHALILVSFMLALTVLTMLFPQPEYSVPYWHSYLLLLIMLITVWLGARYRQSRRLAVDSDSSHR